MSLPDAWATCRLEDLLGPDPGSMTDGPFGSSLKSEHYTRSGLRVIRLNNVAPNRFVDNDRAYIDANRLEHLRRHEAKPGDLVTAALGDPLGRTCIVPDDIGPAIVKADCFRTRLSARVNSSLISLWLNSKQLARYFDENGKGVGRVRINMSVLRSAPLPLPPAHQQSEIVGRLQRFVDRAYTARREAGRALEAANALKVSGLRAGVTGRLTGDWRATSGLHDSVDQLLACTPPPEQGRGGRTATDKVAPGIAAISVNDPGTELPEGWRWVPLLRLARQETGHTPSRSKAEYWGGDVDWLGIPDARDHHGRTIMRSTQTITVKGLAGSSARLLPARTVCMSRTASVGYVTILGKPMATSQDFVTWTCSSALLPDYLMYALMAEGRGIRRFGRGSTHTTIYFPELRAFNIALPPLEEQQAIVTRVRRLLERADILTVEAIRAIATADQLAVRAVGHAMEGRLPTFASGDGTARDLLAAIKIDRQMHDNRKLSARPRAAPSKPIETQIKPDEASIVPEDLTAALKRAGGRMRAAELWQLTKLEIDVFYRHLRIEVRAGRIVEDADREHLIAY